MNTYPLGQTVRISTATAFTDADGDPVAPDTVTLSVREPAPDRTETSYTGAQLTSSATGSYYRDVTPDVPGTWYYRWEGVIGTSVAVDEDTFHVSPSVFT
jgi:hypothetical protein